MTLPPRPDMCQMDEMVIPPRGPRSSRRMSAASFFLWGLILGLGLAVMILGAMT